MSKREAIKQNLIDNFVPYQYITLEKRFIVISICLVIILEVISRNEGKSLNFVLLIAMATFNIVYSLSLNKMNCRITTSGYLLTAFCVVVSYMIWFGVFVGDGLIKASFNGLWLGVKDFITMLLPMIILRIKDRNRIKNIKRMEKQMNSFEKKMNHIWDKKK